MNDAAQSSYVRKEPAAAASPPIASGGAMAWARKRLFPNGFSSALTIALVLALAWILPGIIRYFFVDAVWSAPNGAACRAPDAGACWAFVAHKIDYFRYGAYPLDQRWRVDATMMLGAVLLGRILWRTTKTGWIAASLFIVAIPLAAAMLTPGPTVLLVRPWPDLALLVGAMAFAAALWGLQVGVTITASLFFIAYPIVGVLLLRGAPWLGLRLIDTSLWGGLLVSLIVSIVGIVVSIPGGVLLALGRRSRMPAVQACSAAFVEIVRGVPLVTVLFMANTMLPLFVPQEYTPDRLLRPLIGVSVFAAVYMAEVVRGGLQAMPKGQYEGAAALGLSYWQMMRLVILPQALTLVIPGTVNSCIALFKDTTLVAAVGIFDFLNTVDTGRIDPQWAGPSVSTTSYVFAALVYWVFCFGMSRYSQAMERRLNVGRRR